MNLANVDRWPPGSPKAVRKGCTCPTFENAGGRGFPLHLMESGVEYVYAMDCPVHWVGEAAE